MKSLHDQLTTAISDLTKEEIAEIVIAYEPAWAIGTGHPAKPDEVQKEINFIKKQIKELFNQVVADAVRVLYGGSVDDHSARAYLELDGCDGVLPGSASLNYHQFSGIVEAAHKLHEEKNGKKN